MSEFSYFSLEQPPNPRQSRHYGSSPLSPGSCDVLPSPATAISPTFELPTPRPHQGSRLSPRRGADELPTPRPHQGPHFSLRRGAGGTPDSSTATKQRRIAKPASHGPLATSGKSSDADDEEQPHAWDYRPRHSRHGSSAPVQGASEHRESLDIQTDHDKSHLGSSDDSAASEPATKTRPSSKPRRLPRSTAKLPPDHLVSSLRASDFREDGPPGEGFGMSSKAFKQLGLGDDRSDPTTAKPPLTGQVTRATGQTGKKPFQMDKSARSSPSASSSEDVSPKEEPRRGSFWRQMSSSHAKVSQTKAKSRGFRIDLAHPSVSFLASEAQKVITPPISAQPILPEAYATVSRTSQNSVPPPSTPGLAPLAEILDTDVKPDHCQDTFRASFIRELEDTEKYTNVPEHLPSSPLCPKHPKHKSKGTGTCPYHGGN